MGWVIGSNNCVDPRRFPYGPNPLRVMARRGVPSTSRRPQQSRSKNTRSRCLRSERPIGVLSEQKFQARFHIPDNILIQLKDDEALSSTDLPNNMMYFFQGTIRYRPPFTYAFSFQAVISFHVNPSSFSSSEFCSSVNGV